MLRYTYILVKGFSMDKIVDELENILQTKFEVHESEYWGMYFEKKMYKDANNIRVLTNYIDGEWQYKEYKEYSIVIEINKAISDNIFIDIYSYFRDNAIALLYEVEPKIRERHYYYKNEWVLENN